MSRFNRSRHVVTGASAVFLTLMLTACGSSSKSSSSPTPTMDQMTVSPDNGLASSVGGYSLVTDVGSINASKPADFTFHITAPGGSVQTSFAEDQTKLMHFYVVRSDVTGYQHFHPTEGSGNQAGMWSVPLRIDKPGSYRVYASFIATDASNKTHELVLSRPLTVPGSGPDTALPAASDTATVDGYMVKFSGQPMAGMTQTMTATITKDGQQVTNLERYLGTFAHLTAFKADNPAFIHLHPTDPGKAAQGGPTLQFMTDFPAKGSYRVFVQFQTSGQLHTAGFTVTAG
jgi:hypothetical protein